MAIEHAKPEKQDATSSRQRATGFLAVLIFSYTEKLQCYCYCYYFSVLLQLLLLLLITTFYCCYYCSYCTTATATILLLLLLILKLHITSGNTMMTTACASSPFFLSSIPSEESPMTPKPLAAFGGFEMTGVSTCPLLQ